MDYTGLEQKLTELEMDLGVHKQNGYRHRMEAERQKYDRATQRIGVLKAREGLSTGDALQVQINARMASVSSVKKTLLGLQRSEGELQKMLGDEHLVADDTARAMRNLEHIRSEQKRIGLVLAEEEHALENLRDDFGETKRIHRKRQTVKRRLQLEQTEDFSTAMGALEDLTFDPEEQLLERASPKFESVGERRSYSEVTHQKIMPAIVEPDYTAHAIPAITLQAEADAWELHASARPPTMAATVEIMGDEQEEHGGHHDEFKHSFFNVPESSDESFEDDPPADRRSYREAFSAPPVRPDWERRERAFGRLQQSRGFDEHLSKHFEYDSQQDEYKEKPKRMYSYAKQVHHAVGGDYRIGAEIHEIAHVQHRFGDVEPYKRNDDVFTVMKRFNKAHMGGGCTVEPSTW